MWPFSLISGISLPCFLWKKKLKIYIHIYFTIFSYPKDSILCTFFLHLAFYLVVYHENHQFIYTSSLLFYGYLVLHGVCIPSFSQPVFHEWAFRILQIVYYHRHCHMNNIVIYCEKAVLNLWLFIFRANSWKRCHGVKG